MSLTCRLRFFVVLVSNKLRDSEKEVQDSKRKDQDDERIYNLIVDFFNNTHNGNAKCFLSTSITIEEVE